MIYVTQQVLLVLVELSVLTILLIVAIRDHKNNN